MPTLVVGNSVVMGWCFEDEVSPYAQAVVDLLATGAACQPAIWPLEVGNTLLVAERKKRILLADTLAFLAILDDLNIEVEQESPKRMFAEILSLARRHQLSTYDASYLDLAQRRGLPLATQDKALRRAAKEAGVELFQP